MKPKNLQQPVSVKTVCLGPRSPGNDETCNIGDGTAETEESQSYLKLGRFEDGEDQPESGRDLSVLAGMPACRCSTHRSRTSNTAQSSEDKVGKLIGHERDDEVDDPQSEEAVCEYRFGRVEVGHSTPEQEERGECDGVCGLL